jgi:hypothetical protein
VTVYLKPIMPLLIGTRTKAQDEDTSAPTWRPIG